MKNTIYLFLFILSLSLSSCGGGEHSTSADTGSASFGLTFEQPSAPTAMKLAQSMATADICSSYGIDSISGTVYNSSNSVIATGGPWACSAHTGTIYNIPPGSNIRITIKGTVSGSVVWQGETTGATIYSGQDTNVGTVTMTYTGSDTTAPANTTVADFINSGATSTTSTSVTLALSATDNVGVTAYYASETSTTPSSTAAGWTSVTSTTAYSASVSFTLSSVDGTKTVYVWFKDAAGNVSASASDSINLSTTGSDTTAPANTTVADFINSGATSTTSTSVTLALSATDNVGVTAYYASETSTTPSSTAAGWTSVTSTTAYSASVSFTLSSGNATKTVYVWFKDAAGNVSAAVSDSISLSTAAVVVVHVPDTGQTGDYTTTYGEDSDYTINPPSYTDNGDGTITDNVTGLLWQKQDDATARTWTDAGTYCTGLSLAGYTGWRLPADFELMTIVDYGTYNLSINTTYFPNTQLSYYWSSTTYAYSTTDAWYVHFGYGYVYSSYKTGYYYVRCVRGGQ